ncbi:hypothetical protein ASG88_19720 [Nocardioides sp. Soil777]|nr:hypothetical protein ASG88_19720 [Nocardioides sp. Soil777]
MARQAQRPSSSVRLMSGGWVGAGHCSPAGEMVFGEGVPPARRKPWSVNDAVATCRETLIDDKAP